MNFLFFALLLCASVCFRASQAFVPSPGSLSSTRTAAAPPAAPAAAAAAAAPVGRRWSRGASQGVGTRKGKGLRLGMMFGRGRSSPPQLSKEELADMAKSREEANTKVEAFLEERRAEKDKRKNELLEEQREKVANRIKAEKEDAEHKKVYIPQRLEEIEEEEAKLQDRMSAFNSKIKDKEIKEL